MFHTGDVLLFFLLLITVYYITHKHLHPAYAVWHFNTYTNNRYVLSMYIFFTHQGFPRRSIFPKERSNKHSHENRTNFYLVLVPLYTQEKKRTNNIFKQRCYQLYT